MATSIADCLLTSLYTHKPSPSSSHIINAHRQRRYSIRAACLDYCNAVARFMSYGLENLTVCIYAWRIWWCFWLDQSSVWNSRNLLITPKQHIKIINALCTCACRPISRNVILYPSKKMTAEMDTRRIRWRLRLPVTSDYHFRTLNVLFPWSNKNRFQRKTFSSFFCWCHDNAISRCDNFNVVLHVCQSSMFICASIMFRPFFLPSLSWSSLASLTLNHTM